MTDFYNFPPLANLDELTAREQLAKIKTEYREAYGAEIRYRCTHDSEARTEYGMELMDIIHAAETALRMEFDDDEVDELRAQVIEKNQRRSYYG